MHPLLRRVRQPCTKVGGRLETWECLPLRSQHCPVSIGHQRQLLKSSSESSSVSAINYSNVNPFIHMTSASDSACVSLPSFKERPRQHGRDGSRGQPVADSARRRRGSRRRRLRRRRHLETGSRRPGAPPPRQDRQETLLSHPKLGKSCGVSTVIIKGISRGDAPAFHICRRSLRVSVHSISDSLEGGERLESVKQLSRTSKESELRMS